MNALLIGLAVGTVIGVVGTLVLGVDPLRRERNVWRQRIIQEQLRTFGAQAMLAAERMERQPGNMHWSRKAELHSV